MRVVYYPDQENIESGKGPSLHDLDKIKKKRPDLWALVYETMKKVKKADNLDFLKNKKEPWVAPLKYSKKPVHEFRIPPIKSGGVVRLYFIYDPIDTDKIIICSSELKKKTKGNPTKIKAAEEIYEEVYHGKKRVR